MQITNKSEQRAKYKALRCSLDSKTKMLSDKLIYNRFVEFSESNTADLYLLYVSNGFEIDTKAIISRLLENGKNIAVPKCLKNTNKMRFYIINSLDQLSSGMYGILEPNDECPPITDTGNAICVVPAICFDGRGYRIGYGKGFYDRFFSENDVALKIGLCYDEFVISEVCSDRYDVAVDGIITENQFIKCNDT